MIVGFSKHGTGGGKGPTKYVTDKEREGRKKFPPVVIRGDAEQTRNLIDSLDFKWKYTSGVLSFAPGEIITTEMESEIINRFESLAFAGLDQDQYNILWVRHTHADHHELHFITPRVELETGKSLNIKPPGDLAKEHFDDFRSEVNAKFGLADPTDPDRTKNVASPNHELKIAAGALRKGEKAPDNMRQLIDTALTQRALKGLIQSREDVLHNIKELGLEIRREGKNYITVSDPNSTDRWRLKGGLYAQDFEPSAAIERADIARERDYSRPDQEAANRYAARVERHISARTKYHESRYQTPEKSVRLGRDNEQNNMVDIDRPKSLNRYILRKLGNDGISNIENFRELRNDRYIESENGTTENLQRRNIKPEQHKLPNSTERWEDHRYLQLKSESNSNILGKVEDDRTRKSLIERIEEFRSSIQRATNGSKERSASFGRYVQNYNGRKQKLNSASELLNAPSRKLERAIGDSKQSFQKMIKERIRSQRMSRSGPSFSM